MFYAGGLQYPRVKAKVVEHHENIVNPERCVVRLDMKYISECPNHVIGGSLGSGVQVIRFGSPVRQ